MSSLRFNYLILFYLLCCRIGSYAFVNGFVVVQDVTSTGVHLRLRTTSSVSKNNKCRSSAETIQPRAVIVSHPTHEISQHGRRCNKSFETTSHSPRKSVSSLNAVPISISSSILGRNAQLSIAMGLIHLLLGSLGAPIVAKAISTWYNKISKPSWTPPNRIFAPTWTALYIFMGIAFSRIVQQLSIVKTAAYPLYMHPLLLVWIGHVLLNIVWAPIFFGLQKLRAGLYINYGLLFSICGIIIPWYAQIDIVATYLVFPYATWLLYATFLNRSICVRNPEPYNTARFYADLFTLQQQAALYANLKSL